MAARLNTRNVLFQLHWFLGITAGLVLAVIGATGALLSFEDEILAALNRETLQVMAPAGVERLSPQALTERISELHPELRANRVTLWPDLKRSAQVNVGPVDEDRSVQAWYVDPYTGARLTNLTGREFFRSVRRLHRFLLLPDNGNGWGRQITGFSTIALVFFAFSGLYLRWPRRPLDLRSWLRLDLKLKGRSLYWSLHSILGTWVLVAYLLMALTGLTWSYSWYRASLVNLLVSEQERPNFTPRSRPGEVRVEAADLDRAWATFMEISGGDYSRASITSPRREGASIEIRYVPGDAQHARAYNRLFLNADSAEVLSHERFSDESLGARISKSFYVLHTGEWFGMPGRIIYMLASILMPLFAVTGYLLYLDRRRKKQANLKAAAALASAPSTPLTGPPILVAYASQGGTAEQLALRAAQALRGGGRPADVMPVEALTPAALQDVNELLLIIATFGEGEPPDHARGFATRTLQAPWTLQHLSFGLLALGDSKYPDYCRFGTQVEAWLRASGAQTLFDPIQVDDGDVQALTQWQTQLQALGGDASEAQWTPPPYASWQLVDRCLLNSGSAGAPIYTVRLFPDEPASWRAGDIIEILPRHDRATVETFIAAIGADPDASVNGMTLRDALVERRLPDPASVQTTQPEALLASLEPLPRREYSIASLPNDHTVDIIVRQMTGPDGVLGLGSGFLTAHAALGASIQARLRPNPNFHPPEEDRPMILVGSGTGLAGLRAHLKARVGASHHRNWLIFGERSATHDYLFRDEIEGWQTQGFLQRLDLAFSRDQPQRVYVQDRLLEAAKDCREWIRQGAAIYVCGSLTGMAAGVDHALTEILGEPAMQALREQGRYRRDVY